MFWDRLEKRDTTGDTFNWTAWTKGEDTISENSLREQNYITGLNILGSTIAKLPVLIKQTTDKGEIEANKHYLWDLLRLRPNMSMNSFDCLKSLIMLYKHYGTSGLYIQKDYKGNVTGLYPCKINQFTVDDVGLIKSTKTISKVLVDFDCVGTQGSCLDTDMIILRDNSLDGINCKATKSYVKDTIDTNLQAQNYQKNLFANGLTSKAVVQLTSDIKEESELKKIQAKFSRIYSSNNRIFTVPAGYSISPLNLSLVDSQFAELKINGKKDIASTIGIPFSLIDTGSLSEEDNISYLTNTISPILVQIEQEMDWKLLTSTDRRKGYKIRFNVNSMLRTSAEKQKNIIIDYVKNGVYSLEYARNLLGVNTDFNNETVTLPSGQILLKDLIDGKATWQKSTDINTKGGA
ncbi:phage portal protein, HK97 family [Clostridium pasteurianum DSM 525 = ATCC 6013]|uniref:Phage portal protein, HK97 family n=1 Tax=Clostridium pasteurianum DSM 525 = ATCC 6013 TaxID=1262449 RepID=A0A0H3J698_CLOPA|nr:phage portal protein [Clostridium pasteurianum]AJA49536.1 phage portal protein, HK97 family [Clostridium pasteurianum DSM 525 = ATCC 6013]AJA53524.1 phage portal protein, HK97 family [Clostridium pasteurianum DSM 525 = ATCC 6013]AOZ76694.1 phage portal protein [Clostridium pasteurianum DSM 525 = ATCC 6013]AOZ80491.1 phage portal protein [Clostridium pasteurianum]ELP58946.1 phage portal protein, HK97 family [Clostridium pasteurianum DSM 525 = ATCC 6013]